MSDLPAPLTPPDCDLRGYEFMPLFGTRLFGSELYSMMLQNPRAGVAALKLWWAAWQQCPAGSLPDDERQLALMADFGGQIRVWQRHAGVALHGFVKCSDGRLYHPLICEAAREAYERRLKERDRKRRQRSPETPGGGNVPQDGRGMSRGTGAGQEDEDRAVQFPHFGANEAPVMSPSCQPRVTLVSPQRHPTNSLRSDDADNELKSLPMTVDVPRDGQCLSHAERRGEEIRKKEERVHTNTLVPLPRASARVSVREEPSFSAFWEAYPKKVGIADARRAFEKAMTKTTLADILGAIQAQKIAGALNTERRYIPYPATWLNREQWADKIPVVDPVAERMGFTEADQEGFEPLKTWDEIKGTIQ